MWQRAMVGHAVANSVYVAAANRVGHEAAIGEGGEANFYGSSFIADPTGTVISEAGRSEEGLVLAELHFGAAQRFRAGFGFFRDRRPELYEPLLELADEG
jgi:N-carbamoylputrescine amidase